MQSEFDESRFKRQVKSALQAVETVLHNNRAPVIAEDVHHQYQDKYLLANFLTTVAIASNVNCLEALGMNAEHFKTIYSWAQEKSNITLRFKTEERCAFKEKKTRKVTDPVERVTEVSVGGIKAGKVTEKVVRKITEYFWKFDVEYELSIYRGSTPEKKIVLRGRKADCILITGTEDTPKPKVSCPDPMEVNLTWLFSNINENSTIKFSIDRNHRSCKTPRRNKDVDSAFGHFSSFFNWAKSVEKYFTVKLFPTQREQDINLSSLTDARVFVPVLPLFEKKKSSKESTEKKSTGLAIVASISSKGPLLSLNDVNDFLNEEKRSFQEKFGELEKTFPSTNLITYPEATIVVTLMHAQSVSQHFADGLNYIEKMLYSQLVQAIGKEVTPIDFINYMQYHNRLIFKQEYQPIPFCYAIRRPQHYPEGTLSIEAQLDNGSLADPIPTLVRSGEATKPMYFYLNASTKVAFHGERNLHAWITHRFAGQSGSNLNLVARSRQFSCYIMLLGRIASADLFDPKYAIIIQNKDELKIPLMLETIPTPKEFKDAISSLSPEMQRFAKAYRSMQLSSTLFGVLIVQIKPQLEKLLNLTYDSLTKEIRLTQDLLELFIKYQIPSDLLSFAGSESENKDGRMNCVKKYVSEMQNMINLAKQQEINQVSLQHQYEHPQYYQEEEEKSWSDGSESCDEEENDDCDIINEPVILSRALSPRMTLMRKSEEKESAPLKREIEAPRKEVRENSREVQPQARSLQKISLQQKLPPPQQSKPQQSQPQPSQPSQPSQPQPSQPQPSQPQPQKQGEKEIFEISDKNYVPKQTLDIDYTKIPKLLDSKFMSLDEDSSLRPTIINPSENWTRNTQKALLAPPVTENLSTVEQGEERKKALDLLDALTKSGALDLDYASLHVVIAATHTFDKSLMNTIIQDNVNPIEKVERSSLIVATTIHDKSATELVKNEQLDRVSTYSPKLFDKPVEKKSLDQLPSPKGKSKKKTTTKGPK